MKDIFLSMDFWIGILGALIGGGFSIFGVYLTMRYQRRLDQEQRRIDKMPLLKIGVSMVSFDREDDERYFFLGISKNEMITSAIPEPCVLYSCISVTATLSAVFNLRVSEMYMEPYGVLEKTAAFAPMSIRLLPDETEKQVLVCLDDVRDNRDILIRFEYQDVFGNAYVQDAVFQYFATDFDVKRKVLELREVCQPQLKMRKVGYKKKENLKVGTLHETLTELGPTKNL